MIHLVLIYVYGLFICLFSLFHISIFFINLSNTLVLTNLRSKENLHNKIFQYCWLWILIIFLIQRYCLSHVWIPFPDGGCGRDFPPTFVVKRGGHWEATPKRIFWENFLVKYCNFVVNLTVHYKVHRSDGRIYVRVFFP
jgi:hypothetical protein